MHRVEGLNDVPPEGVEAAFAMAGYFDDMVRHGRRRARAMISPRLSLSADVGGDRLIDDEIISFLFLMVVAGNETTTKLLANAWYWGWRFPTSGPRFRPTRCRSPTGWKRRCDSTPPRRCSCGSRRARSSCTGRCCPTATGPAPRRFGQPRRPLLRDPDRYDIDRDTSKLVSFGSGRHFCLGAALARLEGRVGPGGAGTDAFDSYEIDPTGPSGCTPSMCGDFARLPTTVSVP